MTLALLVGAGGFVGSVLRYLVSGWVQQLAGGHWLPYGTLTVNVLGCLAIGLLSGLAENLQVLSPQTRALLLIGLLGGFTTFSTFGYETFAMARDGQVLAAVGNMGLQLVLGLAAVWLGYTLSQAM